MGWLWDYLWILILSLGSDSKLGRINTKGHKNKDLENTENQELRLDGIEAILNMFCEVLKNSLKP